MCTYDNPIYPEHFALNCVDWDGCRDACEWAGGRLCKETEWGSACRQSSSNSYPYGATYVEDMCNLGLYGDGKKIAAPGSFRGCEGGLPGVYDMLGNVGEWLDEGKMDSTYRKFKTNSFAHNGPLDLDCSPRCGGNQRDFKSLSIGCRCCRDK